MAETPAGAEVVIIGGGVMGTSAAYHLAAAGARPLLLEREAVGAGSTGKAAGGFRCQFTDDLNIRMARENIRRLARFGEEFGTDIGFKQYGYLFLLEEAEEESFRAAAARQRRHGSPVRMLTPREAERMIPGLDASGLAAASFCPEDGYCTPEAVAQGYARRAAELGARLAIGCEVRRILEKGGRITGVDTNRGAIPTGEVVLTAGAWSGPLAAPLGLDLPVRAEKRHVWLTRGRDGFPRRLPLVIDFASGFYFHREGEGLLLGGREASLEGLAPAVMKRTPSLMDLEVRYGWWGYYGISPDGNALIGTAPCVERLRYAAGFSGHGFQQGPVVGEHLADLVLGRPPAFDLSPLDAGRFARERTVPEAALV